MKEFDQAKRLLSAHDVVVDVMIIDIIEKHANDQFHYILDINIIVSILLTTISISKPYNWFITYFNSVTIKLFFEMI